MLSSTTTIKKLGKSFRSTAQSKTSSASLDIAMSNPVETTNDLPSENSSNLNAIAEAANATKAKKLKYGKLYCSDII